MITPETMRQALLREPPRERAARLRAALDSLPGHERETWLDLVLGAPSLPEDGPDLPAGCVPYCPCPVDLLLLMLDEVALGSEDVFVDIGAGVGRVTTLVHLLTGAAAIGIEVQAGLVRTAREITRELGVEGVATIHADAAGAVRDLPAGTVFFLYCPFSGSRLDRVLDGLESVAATRSIRICCVHVPPLVRPWLEPVAAPAPELVIYRSIAPPPPAPATT